MKGLTFIGSSLEDLKDFPPAAKRAAGTELRTVQRGLMPGDWKPMTLVGPGACEIRVHVDGEWRVIYVAKFASKIYVLHVFRKKTAKTGLSDIRLAQRRYREINHEAKND